MGGQRYVPASLLSGEKLGAGTNFTGALLRLGVSMEGSRKFRIHRSSNLKPSNP